MHLRTNLHGGARSGSHHAQAHRIRVSLCLEVHAVIV